MCLGTPQSGADGQYLHHMREEWEWTFYLSIYLWDGTNYVIESNINMTGWVHVYPSLSCLLITLPKPVNKLGRFPSSVTLMKWFIPIYFRVFECTCAGEGRDILCWRDSQHLLLLLLQAYCLNGFRDCFKDSQEKDKNIFDMLFIVWKMFPWWKPGDGDNWSCLVQWFCQRSAGQSFHPVDSVNCPQWKNQMNYKTPAQVLLSKR